MSNIEFESDNQGGFGSRRFNTSNENPQGPFFRILSKTGMFKNDESIKKTLIVISVVIFALSIIIFLLNI
jgi:hypothetical protein